MKKITAENVVGSCGILGGLKFISYGHPFHYLGILFILFSIFLIFDK